MERRAWLGLGRILVARLDTERAIAWPWVIPGNALIFPFISSFSIDSSEDQNVWELAAAEVASPKGRNNLPFPNLIRRQTDGIHTK